MSGYIFGGLRSPGTEPHARTQKAVFSDAQVASPAPWAKNERLLGDGLTRKYEAMASDGSQEAGAREAAMLFTVAEKHLDEENGLEALKAGESALKAFRELSDTTGIADALRLVIMAHLQNEDYGDALRLATTQLAEFQSKKDQRGEASMQMMIAEVMKARYGSAECEKALAAAVEAVRLFKAVGDQKLMASALITQCKVLMCLAMKEQSKQDWKQAMKLGKDAADTFRKLGDKRGDAKALHTLACVHAYQKDFSSGINYAKEAAGIWQQLGEQKQEACELYYIALWQFDSNSVDNGLTSAEQAVNLFDTIGFDKGYAVGAKGLLVRGLTEKGKSDEALKIAKECADKYKGSSDKLGTAAALSLLAQVLYEQKQTKEAFEASNQAVSIVQKLQPKKDTDRLYEAKLLQKSAWLYLFEGDAEKAETATRTSLSIIQEVGDEAEEGVALLTLANVCAGHSQFGDAMYAAKQARAIFKDQGNAVAEGVALLNVARLHFNFNRLRKAEVAAKQAQILFAETGSMGNEADALYLLSHIYLASGEYDQSVRAGKQSQNLWHDIFDEQAEFNQLLLMCQAALFTALQAGAPLVGEKPKPEWTKVLGMLEETQSKGNGMEINQAENMSQVCFMMGQAYYGTREYAKASKVIDEGKSLAKSCGNGRIEAHLNLLGAYISMSNGRKSEALSAQKKAAAAFKKLEDIEGELEAERLFVEIQGPRQPKAKKFKPPKKEKKEKKTKKKKEKSKKTKIVKQGGGQAVQVYKGPSAEEVLESVKGAAMDLIGSETLDGDTPLMEAGLDSLAAVEYGSILQKQFSGVQLPSTLMFDHPTTNMIAELIATDLKEKMTVTEYEGGEEVEVEVSDDDDDDDSSSEEEKRKKKKSKKPKAKKQVVRKTGGGEAVQVYKGPSAEEVLESVKGAAMDLIGSETLDGDTPLMEAGLDSLAAVEYGSILQKQFTGVQLPSTLMFDHPTTNMIAELIATDLKEKMTVTEYEGGGEVIEEVSDDDESDDESDEESDDESSDDDNEPDTRTRAITSSGGNAASSVAVYAGPSQGEILQTITGVAMDLIGTEELHGESPLMESGLDSLAAVELGSILQKQFTGVQLPSTLMFDYPSSTQIADFVYQAMSTDQANFK